MRVLASLALLLLVQACKHPLAIIGEGDIVDLNAAQNGSAFGCTLEDFQSGAANCVDNDVTGDYFVNYSAVPRAGWRFDGWEGSCGHLSEGDDCRFDVPASLVAAWDANFSDITLSPLTAVFVELAVPVADAGSAQDVNEQTSVTLDASGSTDADGTIESYVWTQTGGTVVQFDPSIAVTTNPVRTFIAPELTTTEVLTFAVTVTDDDGLSASDTVAVTVNPVNLPPTADAGDNQGVNEFDQVTLAGTAADADGTVTVAWSQIQGATVALSDPASLTTTFTAPALVVAEVLIFELTATDNEGATASDQVSIAVGAVNIPPMASAAADSPVNEGSTVQLDGSGSSDDAGIVSFSWSQVGGTVVTLTGADTDQASFTAPTLKAAAIFSFELTVTDGEGASDSDTVSITVNPVNVDPTADAGDNDTVVEQTTVQLDGSASTDSDGEIDAYLWEQTGGTAVTLTGADSDTASFTAPELTAMAIVSFQLTVTDDEGATDTDTVSITVTPVNTDPTADAGENASVAETTAVQLDGTGSADSDGEIDSYSWSQTGGDTVTLTNANTDTATFTAPTLETAAIFTFALTVTDNEGATDSDSVSITVTPVNADPTADAGDDADAQELTTVELDGSGSTDSDGTIASYAWTQLSGTAVTVSGANTDTASFTAPDIDTATETLTFRLTVTDNEGATADDDVSITVSNVAETADVVVNIDRIDPAGEFTVALSLDGSQSDTIVVGEEATQVIFTEVPQGSDFAVSVSSAPDAPATCAVFNGTGTVNATGNTAFVDCEFLVADMGLETALYNCVSDNGDAVVLDDVEDEIDCYERGITSLDGIEFLATKVEELDVGNNELTNSEIPKLHALTMLKSVDIGGNEEVFDNSVIADLEAALPFTRVNYSNLNTALVRFFKFELTFDPGALAIPEEIGTVQLYTDYWAADEPDRVLIRRVFSDNVSTVYETTAGSLADMGGLMDQNSETRELSYIVDFTNIDDALSCDMEATVDTNQANFPDLPEFQTELITVAVNCERNTSTADITYTVTGVRPLGGLNVALWIDNGQTNFDGDDIRHFRGFPRLSIQL